ncbi:MAG: hypothetical protein FWH27_15085 [Planctomycetaceae bacterium]|nr:hypothetical protein [Planctomycetaceae bacterium]
MSLGRVVRSLVKSLGIAVPPGNRLGRLAKKPGKLGHGFGGLRIEPVMPENRLSGNFAIPDHLLDIAVREGPHARLAVVTVVPRRGRGFRFRLLHCGR